MQDTTIIIPYHNGAATIERLLDSIPTRFDVVLVDDHSDEPYQKNSRDRDNLRVIRPTTRGYFAGAVNSGINSVDGNVLVLNQDAYFTGEQWVSIIEKNVEQYAMIGESISGNHPAWPDSYVQGTFMWMRRDAIEKIGGLDAEHFPLWGGTADWQCRASRAGFDALPLQAIPDFVHERDGAYGSSIESLLKKAPQLKNRMIRTPPTVSVIIPCHNYGRYLTDAVHSLIGGETCLGTMPPQSYQGFEIIIVNDASDDNTREVAEGFAKNTSAIKLINLPPSTHKDGHKGNGLPFALNVAIKAAHGRYITILSADDMMGRGRIEKMLAIQEENPHSMIYDDMVYFKSKPKPVFEGWRSREYDFDYLLNKNYIHSGIMYPKQGWIDTGGYPERMRHGREDWAFNVAMGKAGYCGIRMPEALYLYRREGQGRSEKNTNSTWMGRFARQMRGLFPALYKGERPMGCCGGSSRNNNNKAAAALSGNLPPAPAGLVEMEYVGENDSIQTWFGGVTGRQYTFGGGKNNFYVDTRDAAWFTQQVDARGQLFSIVVLPDKEKPIASPAEIATLYDAPEPKSVKPVASAATVQEEPAKQTQPETVENVADAPTVQDASPVEAELSPNDGILGDPPPLPPALDPPFDPNNFTLGGIDTQLRLLTATSPKQIAAMMELEIAGKNRKGALERLENYSAY